MVNNQQDTAKCMQRLSLRTYAACAHAPPPRGLIFLNLDMGWQDVYSRASLLFFVVAFLTFMSIAGYVSFTERVKVCG